MIGGLGVHALDFTDAIGVPAQGAAGHRRTLAARHEDGGLGPGHLLHRHVRAILRRGQSQQRGVQFGDEAAHVLAQGTFGSQRDGHGYSTTLGTRKKWSAVAGAFATMSSAMPPSVTWSARFFSVMATTRVIGSTASVSTSSSCLIHAKMPESSFSNAFASVSLTLMRARRAIRRTVASSTSIASR